MTPTRLAALWALIIWIGCSLPGDAVPFSSVLFSFDKLVHVGLFAVLGALALRARPGRGWAILLVGTAFGVAIELWQGTPWIGRSADAADALADAVGLAFGLGLWAWWSNDSEAEVSR